MGAGEGCLCMSPFEEAAGKCASRLHFVINPSRNADNTNAATLFSVEVSRKRS